MSLPVRCFELAVVVLLGLLLLQCSAELPDSKDFQEQLSVLSKQVTALLERRREDVQTIEDHIRRKLVKSREFEDVREEVENLRSELEQMRSGTAVPYQVHHPQQQQHNNGNQAKNDHLTLKWLSNVVQEARTEIVEMQTTLNSTALLQNRERVDTEVALLKGDVSHLNKELELARSTNAKYEAEILEIREELDSLKEQSRASTVTCAKAKSQLKSVQIEWNNNWKNLVNRKLIEESAPASKSRHQRILKKHVLNLEHTVRSLKLTNEDLLNRIEKLESRYDDDTQNDSTLSDDGEYDRINGNEVENYLKAHKINELRDEQDEHNLMVQVRQQQSINTKAIANLTKQFTNFDKLHSSMLELLENVESIEDRVDKMMPEFRKEISKLEFQATDSASKLSALKEDQVNIRTSVKAISVSVSNLQDKTEAQETKLQVAVGDVENLKKSSSVQTSKLHDHILKSEASTADVNATKSTIHLVQELKSFEKEYKSIVNKLPHDCSAVDGPNGVYLISPGDGEPILAYCSQGWTTVQKRYDGSVNFNRNWNDYSNGFGSATGEHWLGNRNLHYLTRNNCTKLEINMKDIYGKYWQATYDDFRVNDFDNGFRLVVNKYHGNASDALDYQNNMEFSTVDNDRDISNTHCASNYEGGWWFSHCQHANLNGRYNLGLTWFDNTRNEWIAVATSEMRVKRQRQGCT